MNTVTFWVKWLIMSIVVAVLSAILAIANACYGFWVSSVVSTLALICCVWCINKCYKKIKAKGQLHQTCIGGLGKTRPCTQNQKRKESAH